MAYQLINGAQFLHIPKTGGSWVRSFLDENHLLAQKRGHAHTDYDHNLLHDWIAFSGKGHLKKALNRARLNLFPSSIDSSPHENEQHIFRFCFVRHPLTWYESWWKFNMQKGWKEWGVQNSAKSWHVNSILNGLGDPDFNQFVRNVVHARPGYVSELYFAFTKPGISFIGRTENLRADLMYVLDLLELAYDRERIQQKPKKNVSSPGEFDIEWEPQLKRTVMLLELPALLHFGYLSLQEAAEFGISENILPHKAMQRRFNDILEQTPGVQETKNGV